MKKQILSEELKRMNKLAGLMNESDSVDEARYGRGSVDPWADIETGGEYSKSKERVSASYKRQKEEDSLGSTSYQSFTNKIKRLGNLMKDDEAVEMMDDMKRMLSQDEIMNVYNFVDRNNISSPIYTYLDQYKGETGSYGLEENGGFDIEKTKQPVDLSQYDLEPLRQKFLRMHGEMPTDEDLRNIISVMKLEEAQDSEVVMIQEGQLGKAIARMLFEELIKEGEPEWDDLVNMNGNYYVVYDNEIDAENAIVNNEQGVNLLSSVFDVLKGKKSLEIVNNNKEFGSYINDPYDELVNIFKQEYKDKNMEYPKDLTIEKINKLIVLYIIKYNVNELNGFIEFKNNKIYVEVPDNYFGDEKYDSGNEFLIKSKTYRDTVSLKSIEDGNITDKIKIDFINKYKNLIE